jgi:hypothetical protein
MPLFLLEVVRIRYGAEPALTAFAAIGAVSLDERIRPGAAESRC